jgi:purine-binding chemotaxis protein CheW
MRPRASGRHGAIDWADLRHRLEATGRRLAGGAATSAEADAQVLEERARVLARPTASSVPSEALEVLTFDLGGETYGIESRYVVQVFRPADVAVLPEAEPPLFGVTAWRGDLLSVLDLRPTLGIPTEAADAVRPVVAVAADRAAFGLLVDGVHGLIRLRSTDVRPVSPDAARPGREYLRGITGHAVLVLDAGALLALAGGGHPLTRSTI